MTEVKGCGTCKKCFIHTGKNPIMAKPNETAQTHTVHTDALGTIGMILPEGAGRDAIHIAVEPAKSGETVFPGQHVGYKPNGLVSATAEEKIGIVDPFLTGPVYPQQPFWLLVYPRTITSLRHVWEHPAFPNVVTEKIIEVIKEVPIKNGTITSLIYKNEASKKTPEQARAWLEAWCDSNDCPSFYEILEAFENEGEWTTNKEDIDGYHYGIRVDGEYVHVSGSDAHGEIPEEFYDHLEIVLGRRVRSQPKYFSCSC